MTDDAPKPVYRGLLAALLLDEKPWSWNWKYNPSLKEHMHALGVIAANYNDLEGQFYRLFYITQTHFEVGKLVFSKLNNAQRMEVARKVAETQPLSFRERYEHFISGYGTATDNRNILMHSKAHNASLSDLTSSHLTLAKPSKKTPDENNFISLDVAELRSVADDMAEFAMFGSQLFYWRIAALSGGTITWEGGETATPTLPDKPRLPRALTLSTQPDQATAPPQLEASGE
ncbi:hypothetical protein [Bradyrhizobium cytisi]|uniref:Uncharacterized protein n=1 Tax=Bradyrhizobium cytisi TaxID=515489 RepID=A0A5S4WDP6_9BRAD|nr:hypothetical protein [Bradyrhizobium cytisi]TYL80326.1 hypothetical protein FXB38_25580 [Bradyrhizobium cytisi]